VALRKITRFSMVRIVLALAVVGGTVAVSQLLVKALKGGLSLAGTVPALYYATYLISSVLVTYFVYRAYVRIVEERPLTELSRDGAPRELGIGMMIGLGLVSTTVGILWLLGDYRITGAGAWSAIFVALANDGAGAFVEEILFRGVVFRITEERLGTWIAIAISAVLFALLHLTSANATVTSTIVVGLEAGVLLSAAYALTGRLWLAIGIHFAWDFARDAIFGIASGASGLVRAEVSGPGLLSGGSSGIEGSSLALFLCLMVSAYLLARAARKGRIVRPFWQRAETSSSPARDVAHALPAWHHEREV
jgi:membrane protease YdiL (CAAX protease family)